MVLTNKAVSVLMTVAINEALLAHTDEEYAKWCDPMRGWHFVEERFIYACKCGYRRLAAVCIAQRRDALLDVTRHRKMLRMHENSKWTFMDMGLQQAAVCEHPHLFHLLVNAGANVQRVLTRYMSSHSRNCKATVVRAFIDISPGVETHFPRYLSIMCMCGNQAVVNLLLARGTCRIEAGLNILEREIRRLYEDDELHMVWCRIQTCWVIEALERLKLEDYSMIRGCALELAVTHRYFDLVKFFLSVNGDKKDLGRAIHAAHWNVLRWNDPLSHEMLDFLVTCQKCSCPD